MKPIAAIFGLVERVSMRMLTSLLAVLMLALFEAGTAQAMPDFAAAPAPTAQLAPAVRGIGFQIQPPLSYTGPYTINDSVVIYRWNGPVQSDRHRVFLIVGSIMKPPNTPTRTLLQAVAGMMRTLQDEYVSLKTTPPQRGMIHDIPFYRCYWTGTDKKSGRGMQGVDYVGQAGDTFYNLSADGSASYSKSQFKVAEASLLTFQLK